MGSSLLNIGNSALAAAQSGLLTAGHNIANAGTPNYSRQLVIQTTNIPQATGIGYFGQGVRVDSVRRQYDSLLAAELRSAQSQASHSQAYSEQISRIDSLLSDAVSGVSPAVDEFFAGVHNMASNPADVSARQNVLSAAQTLASRFNEMDARLSSLRQTTNQRIKASVAEVNTIGSQLALLNGQIAGASRVGTQPPNDLLDKRDALSLELSRQAGSTIMVADNGDYNVFLGNGQALVLGTQTYLLTTRPDPADAQNLQVGLQTGASMVLYRARDLAGGQLGGLLAFRDEMLDGAQNAIGRVALALGAAFNAQQGLGLDRTGAAGRDLFALGGPQVLTQSAGALSATITDYAALTTSDYRLKFDGASYTMTRLSDGNQTNFANFPQTIDGITYDLAPLPAPAANDSFLIQPTRNGAALLAVLFADTNQLAAAAPIRTSASLANMGNAQISTGKAVTGYAATPLASDATLTFAAASGTLNGFPATSAVTLRVGASTTTYAAGTPVPYTAGATIEWDGIQVQISGRPAEGDRFMIEPNLNGIGDNRNALALAALQTGAALGGVTLQQAYGQFTSQVGNKARELQVAASAQNAVVSQVRAARESISGVNLDEEAADLLRFQQAYQAAGKLMGLANTLFDTILNLAR